MVTNGNLHYTILKYIIDNGFAPDVETLSEMLKAKGSEVEQGLYALQEYHGVVLHPNEPKVWVIHPFSLAPTNFLIRSAKGVWWGNCAWCSLGIAALLKEDLTITTRLGAYDEQIVIHITDGEVLEKNLYIHFPIPMKKAWDNVIYTCSNMLVFKDEEQINSWTKRHNIAKGDIQPIGHVWEFSKRWYGSHLNPEWKKWTMEEAKALFTQFNLTNEIWNLETSNARF
ncbi:MAG: alkylmercury lyase family protein [Flavisolibacter sp.]|nr:alkylmercury lyase family protein [Flavisolibacter sp.]MBD0364903.1 alkylmercury lyase family protein [Flavisolibacter sp.]MBD0376856.1 alkylmercury lyase family protein [Flavisolibacter sp.]